MSSRFEWSHLGILTLLGHIESQPCIWNLKTKTYKNRTLKDVVWRSIVDDVSTSDHTMSIILSHGIKLNN